MAKVADFAPRSPARILEYMPLGYTVWAPKVANGLARAVNTIAAHVRQLVKLVTLAVGDVLDNER